MDNNAGWLRSKVADNDEQWTANKDDFWICKPGLQHVFFSHRPSLQQTFLDSKAFSPRWLMVIKKSYCEHSMICHIHKSSQEGSQKDSLDACYTTQVGVTRCIPRSTNSNHGAMRLHRSLTSVNMAICAKWSSKLVLWCLPRAILVVVSINFAQNDPQSVVGNIPDIGLAGYICWPLAANFVTKCWCAVCYWVFWCHRLSN